MATSTITRPAAPTVGERKLLATYTLASGHRIIYGQRVLGHVRFLPSGGVVLVASSQLSEDRRCRCREALPAGTRPDAIRPERQNGPGAGPGRRDGRS